MAATTQALWQKLSRATSQALMPTGNPAMSKAKTLAMTPPTLAQAARATAATLPPRAMAAAPPRVISAAQHATAAVPIAGISMQC